LLIWIIIDEGSSNDASKVPRKSRTRRVSHMSQFSVWIGTEHSTSRRSLQVQGRGMLWAMNEDYLAFRTSVAYTTKADWLLRASHGNLACYSVKCNVLRCVIKSRGAMQPPNARHRDVSSFILASLDSILRKRGYVDWGQQKSNRSRNRLSSRRQHVERKEKRTTDPDFFWHDHNSLSVSNSLC
jgi:hypothetical protein